MQLRVRRVKAAILLEGLIIFLTYVIQQCYGSLRCRNKKSEETSTNISNVCNCTMLLQYDISNGEKIKIGLINEQHFAITA